MDAEFKALLATLVTKDDLAKVASKEDLSKLGGSIRHELGSLRRDVWEIAGDVSRLDEKLESLRKDLREASVNV